VTALRSGEYTQGRGALAVQNEDGVRHCCLGVLCDLAVKAGVNVPVTTAPGGLILFDGSDLVLPFSVQRWADIEGINPDVSGYTPRSDGRAVTLAELNDGISHHHVDPHSFEEIAQIIEERF